MIEGGLPNGRYQPRAVFALICTFYFRRLVFLSFPPLLSFKMPGGFHPPPSVIASWPEPNYVDPEARGKGLIVTSGIFGISAFLVVVARLAVRIRIHRRLGLDDYFLTLGLVRMNPPYQLAFWGRYGMLPLWYILNKYLQRLPILTHRFMVSDPFSRPNWHVHIRYTFPFYMMNCCERVVELAI